MSLIINHNCLKLTWQQVWTMWKTSRWRESTSIYVNHNLESGLLLLREAINLSENSVTQAQTKEHFGDVQQILGQMTLIRLMLMVNLQKKRLNFTSPLHYSAKDSFFVLNTAYSGYPNSDMLCFIQGYNLLNRYESSCQ